MIISALPTPPSRSDSSTFAANADAFLGALPAFAAEANALASSLNSLGFGTYSATSATSMTIGTGSKSLTIESGKSFTVGQAVIIASTASPTNYMSGQVTTYHAGTGALVVNVTATGGSGTISAWTISITAVVAGGGVSPDSIVVLTSGTSWTCPAGVTKAIVSVQGAGGGGSGGNASASYQPMGAGGGTSIAVIAVTPATSYTYAIGAGGTGGAPSTSGAAGSATTFTANGVTYTGNGGGGGLYGTAFGSGGTASNGQSNITGNQNGSTATGYGNGGKPAIQFSATSGTVGGNGAIVLELYK